MPVQSSASVIFDADDTLWDTQPLYERAKRRFFKLMRQVKLPTRGLRRRLDELDHENVARLGYSRRRFPTSIRQTYRQLCRERGVPYRKKVADAAFAIGETVFQVSPVVFGQVPDVLRKLKAQGVKCILITKGDRHVQQSRIRMSGLRRFFDRTYIVPDKKRRDFMAIVSRERIDPAKCWSVGNSLRSDIAPALAAGLNAIWIPRSTWLHEEVRTGRRKRLHVVRSIIDVPKIVATVR